MHHGRGARQMGMDVAEAVRQRDSDAGVQTVVVEDPDQVVVQRERSRRGRERGHDQAGAAGSEGG